MGNAAKTKPGFHRENEIIFLAKIVLACVSAVFNFDGFAIRNKQKLPSKKAFSPMAPGACKGMFVSYFHRRNVQKFFDFPLGKPVFCPFFPMKMMSSSSEKWIFPALLPRRKAIFQQEIVDRLQV